MSYKSNSPICGQGQVLLQKCPSETGFYFSEAAIEEFQTYADYATSIHDDTVAIFLATIDEGTMRDITEDFASDFLTNFPVEITLEESKSFPLYVKESDAFYNLSI